MVAAASSWRAPFETRGAPEATSNDPMSTEPLLPAPRSRLPGPTVIAPRLLNGAVKTAGGPAAPVRLSVPPARLSKWLLAAPTQSFRVPLLLVPLLMADTVNVDEFLTTVPSPMQMLPADHDVGP